MRKLKYTTEEIEDASAYNETDDEKILTLRKKYQEIKNKFDEELRYQVSDSASSRGTQEVGPWKYGSLTLLAIS